MMRVVGAYRIESELGSGGMGVVYRAVEVTSGRVVALKLLRSAHTGDAERRRRFLREARLAETLDHPGVARVHEAGEVDGTVFIAMELVEGRRLRDWIAALGASGDPPSVKNAVALARGIAQAVQYAHRKGIVHRDLKPDNVMVEADLTVRVLDFGLAKLREIEGGAVYEAETETDLTSEGRVMGTPGYMAPEQASGKEVGFRADVFAIGAILYELLTATRAFAGSSPMDVIVAVTRDEPPLPSTKNPGVGAALDRLVMRCLAKSAEQRPTMEELARALGRPALLERGWKGSPRTRRVLGGFALLATVTVVTGLARYRTTRAAPVMTSPIQSATEPAATAVTDLPLPASTVPAALEAYKRALANERDGAEDAAMGDLDTATKLDPELAAAHLRLAQRNALTEALSARGHFAQAVKLRDRLSPRDREFLEAAQPLFQRDPADMDEWRRRLEALATRFPGDAELAYELAVMRNVLGDFDGSAAASGRAVRLDPRFGLAFSALAEIDAYRGQFDAARSTIDRCLALTPGASWCIWVREFIDSQQGRCADNEASARQRIAADPTIQDGYRALAYAMGALGRPPAVIREAIDQAVRRIQDPFASRRFFLNMVVRLAAMQGDFTAALAHAEELRVHLATRSDVSDHAASTYLTAQIEQEAGHPERAAALAKSFLDRKEAWQEGPIVHDFSMSVDLTPPILSFVRHGNAMPKAEYDAALAAYRARWGAGLRGDYRPYLWVYGFSTVVETREDAAEAMRSLPQYAPIPRFIPNGAMPFATVGRTLWLGGREEEGTDHLRAASRQCDALVVPVLWLQTHAWLSDALEKRGDVAGACAELDVVLTRWGAARPRSVTAERARARSRALGCVRSAAAH